MKNYYIKSDIINNVEKYNFFSIGSRKSNVIGQTHILNYCDANNQITNLHRGYMLDRS